jgi:hypothetical protein
MGGAMACPRLGTIHAVGATQARTSHRSSHIRVTFAVLSVGFVLVIDT